MPHFYDCFPPVPHPCLLPLSSCATAQKSVVLLPNSRVSRPLVPDREALQALVDPDCVTALEISRYLATSLPADWLSDLALESLVLTADGLQAIHPQMLLPSLATLKVLDVSDNQLASFDFLNHSFPSINQLRLQVRRAAFAIFTAP